MDCEQYRNYWSEKDVKLFLICKEYTAINAAWAFIFLYIIKISIILNPKLRPNTNTSRETNSKSQKVENK